MAGKAAFGAFGLDGGGEDPGIRQTNPVFFQNKQIKMTWYIGIHKAFGGRNLTVMSTFREEKKRSIFVSAFFIIYSTLPYQKLAPPSNLNGKDQDNYSYSLPIVPHPVIFETKFNTINHPPAFQQC